MFEIVFHVVNGLTELSHLTILPVFPDKVNNGLVEPEQTFEPPFTLPPTEPVVTVTVVAVDVSVAHVPF